MFRGLKKKVLNFLHREKEKKIRKLLCSEKKKWTKKQFGFDKKVKGKWKNWEKLIRRKFNFTILFSIFQHDNFSALRVFADKIKLCV